MDSGIRMYDAGSYVIKLYRTDGKYIHFSIDSGIYSNGYLHITTEMNYFKILVNSKPFYFYDDGVFKLAERSTEPTGHTGGLIYNNNDARFQGYIGSPHNAWGHWLLTSGW